MEDLSSFQNKNFRKKNLKLIGVKLAIMINQIVDCLISITIDATIINKI